MGLSEKIYCFELPRYRGDSDAAQYLPPPPPPVQPNSDAPDDDALNDGGGAPANVAANVAAGGAAGGAPAGQEEDELPFDIDFPRLNTGEKGDADQKLLRKNLELIRQKRFPPSVTPNKANIPSAKYMLCRRRNKDIPISCQFQQSETTYSADISDQAYWYYTYEGFYDIYVSVSDEDADITAFYARFTNAPTTKGVKNGKNILKALIEVFGVTLSAGRIFVCYYFLTQNPSNPSPRQDYRAYYKKFSETVLTVTDKKYLKDMFVRLELWAHSMAYLPPPKIVGTAFESWQNTFLKYEPHGALKFDQHVAEASNMFAQTMLSDLDSTSKYIVLHKCVSGGNIDFYTFTQHLMTEYFKQYMGMYDLDDELPYNDMQDLKNDLENKKCTDVPYFTFITRELLIECRKIVYGEIDEKKNICVALLENKTKSQIPDDDIGLFKLLTGESVQKTEDRYTAVKLMRKICEACASERMSALASILERDIVLLDAIVFLNRNTYKIYNLPLFFATTSDTSQNNVEIKINQSGIEIFDPPNLMYLSASLADENDVQIEFLNTLSTETGLINPVWFFKTLFIMRGMGLVTSENLKFYKFNFPGKWVEASSFSLKPIASYIPLQLEQTDTFTFTSEYEISLDLQDTYETQIQNICTYTPKKGKHRRYEGEETLFDLKNLKPKVVSEKFKHKLEDKVVRYYLKTPKLLYQKLNCLVVTDPIFQLCRKANFRRDATKLFHYMALNEEYHLIFILYIDDDKGPFRLKNLTDKVTDDLSVSDFIIKAIVENNRLNNVEDLMKNWVSWSYNTTNDLPDVTKIDDTSITVVPYFFTEVSKLRLKEKRSELSDRKDIVVESNDESSFTIPEIIKKNLKITTEPVTAAAATPQRQPQRQRQPQPQRQPPPPPQQPLPPPPTQQPTQPTQQPPTQPTQQPPTQQTKQPAQPEPNGSAAAAWT